MRVHFHVFERSDYDSHRCAVCGNKETAATGTGHVDTEGEANRLNSKEETHGTHN